MRVDSVFGLETLCKLQGVNNRAALIKATCSGRFSLCHVLSTWWWCFGKGWVACGNDSEAEPLKLATASWT